MALYDVPLPPECVARTDELTRRPGRSPGEHIDTLLLAGTRADLSKKQEGAPRLSISSVKAFVARIKYT